MMISKRHGFLAILCMMHVNAVFNFDDDDYTVQTTSLAAKVYGSVPSDTLVAIPRAMVK